jgi:VWFA-related protein
VGTQPEGFVINSDPDADSIWQKALDRANREKKVIVAFFRPKHCKECIEFERVSVPHPTIQRRLPAVVFVQVPAAAGKASKQWSSKEPGLALFDRNGVLRARWRTGVPDTTTLGAVLDGVIAVAPHFERAVRQSERAGPDDGEVEAAIGLARLQRTGDARAALERAIANGSPETRQSAVITRALMDANEGNAKKAVEDLDRLIPNAVTPAISAEAWVAAGMIHRSAGERALAIRAFSNGAELAAAGSPVHLAAQQGLEQLRSTAPATPGPIVLIPIRRPVVSGRVTVMTRAMSAAVARVRFTLDGQVVREVARPPFSATVNFGPVPQRHTIRAIAFNERGKEVGSDEQIVNDAGETFSLRMTEPREGQVSGPVRVALSVRAPALSAVQRVVITWNDAERAVLAAPPWQAQIHVPGGQLGILRAVAELENGRTAEDAVLLNASGAVEHADVHLLEIPVTITSREGTTAPVEPRDIIVTDRGKRRAAESIAGSAETPLTIGLLLDSSASMQKPLPDVQEAALRFIETMLTDRDRAFLVTFDSDARLAQGPTSDRGLLRRQIMSIIPDGLTALHDAIALGLLQFEGVKGRRALVVFTDGIDRTSRYGPDDVADLARRMNVPIHIIAARTSLLPVVLSPGVVRRGATSTLSDDARTEIARAYRALERLTASTGGSTQELHRLEELPAFYERIEAALRAQMLVFVRIDPGTRDNEWREIRVDVTRGKFDVRAPEGYYAPR